MTSAVRAEQLWGDNERGDVNVLSVHRRGRQEWAWMIRRRGNPFTASTDQMLRGEYGWHPLQDSDIARSGHRG